MGRSATLILSLALALTSAAPPEPPEPTASPVSATPAPALARGTTIKLATIFPDGSIWHRAFEQMGEAWERETDGDIKLRIYPGGVAGDEPDFVRKMRIGQIHAASMTINGLGELDEGFRVFEIPLFYQSYEEIFHVIEALGPMLEARLEEKGFKLLHWGHGGWVHVFSKQPVRSLADLKRLKMFTWAGDNRMVQWWKNNGFHPVPLAATDIMTGLETGLIEAVPTPPLAALSLQWFRGTPHMLDHRIVPYLGGTVVSTRTWEKLDDDQQEALLEGAKGAEELLMSEVPPKESEAIEAMKERGLSVHPLSDSPENWEAVASAFAEEMRSTVIPEDVFQAALAARDAFRAR